MASSKLGGLWANLTKRRKPSLVGGIVGLVLLGIFINVYIHQVLVYLDWGFQIHAPVFAPEESLATQLATLFEWNEHLLQWAYPLALILITHGCFQFSRGRQAFLQCVLSLCLLWHLFIVLPAFASYIRSADGIVVTQNSDGSFSPGYVGGPAWERILSEGLERFIPACLPFCTWGIAAIIGKALVYLRPSSPHSTS